MQRLEVSGAVRHIYNIILSSCGLCALVVVVCVLCCPTVAYVHWLLWFCVLYCPTVACVYWLLWFYVLCCPADYVCV
jgi:hypothetical protein